MATDEFGTVAEGHVGEFLKFLPGVTMDYAGGNAREISINGAPADNVPVTLDGFSLATAISGISRASAVDMVSINGISRVEVSFSPTPDTSGAALAGSVNMIPRSAFERSRPVFNGSVYGMMRDHRKELHATPVPREDRRSKVYPGFDFSWVVPVNKRFGFTLSAGRTRQFAGQDQVTNTWRGAGTATNGTTFPHTTPDQPYLSTFAVRGGGKETTRHSLSATLDFKIARYDTLSLSMQASRFEEDFLSQTLTFNVGGVLPGNFTPFSTRGTTALGDLVVRGDGDPEKKTENVLPGVSVLAEADVAIFFARFLQLPDREWQPIEDYLKSGKTVIGLRTASHAFKYPKGHPRYNWNDDFGRRALGTPTSCIKRARLRSAWCRNTGHTPS